VKATQILLSQPAFGAAKSIHACAPRNEGVTNAATIATRKIARPGRSVRVIRNARGVPTATATVATESARISELTIGDR